MANFYRTGKLGAKPILGDPLITKAMYGMRSRKLRKYIAIVGEGLTEKMYFGRAPSLDIAHLLTNPYYISMRKILVLIQILLIEMVISWSPLLAAFNPQLYVSAEGFVNQSVTSIQSLGFQATTVLLDDFGLLQASVRVQDPTFSVSLGYSLVRPHRPKVFDSWVAGRINYYCYASANQAFHGIGMYNLVVQTSVAPPWLQLWISLGVEQTVSWSNYQDRSLYGIFPHFRFALSQVFSDSLVCSVFVGSNTLTQYTSNFTFLGGASAAYKVLDGWYVQARSTVRLSDLLSESRVVAMAQVTVAVVWVDKDRRALFLTMMEEMQ